MDVTLTPGQKALARLAIETGRIQREEEVFEQALALWETRERDRTAILAMLDEVELSLSRGERSTPAEDRNQQ